MAPTKYLTKDEIYRASRIHDHPDHQELCDRFLAQYALLARDLSLSQGVDSRLGLIELALDKVYTDEKEAWVVYNGLVYFAITFLKEHGWEHITHQYNTNWWARCWCRRHKFQSIKFTVRM
jgi:hypothetical protein